jgi:drug/metabolite transporter (DMT)-like permease
MTRSYWPLLLVLAAAWGASYLFIKLAVDGGIEPAPMMSARLLVAAALLFAFLALRSDWHSAVGDVRDAWLSCVVIGIVGAAVPMWLVGWGEKHIDSGVAAIAQSTVPICTVLLASRFLPGERVGLARGAGIVVGLAGVAVLAGVDPRGGWWAVAGTLAVVLASLSYASGSVFAQRRVQGTPGPVLATGAMLVGGLVLLPFALVQFPSDMPTAKALLGVAGLSLIGTVVAQLVYFRTLRLHGAARLSFVAYLMPGFALVYGSLLLDERVTAAALGGLALILLGVALGSGATIRRSRSRGDELESRAAVGARTGR